MTLFVKLTKSCLKIIVTVNCVTPLCCCISADLYCHKKSHLLICIPELSTYVVQCLQNQRSFQFSFLVWGSGWLHLHFTLSAQRKWLTIDETGQRREDEERGSFENWRRENEKRGKEEMWNCDFAFLAAELKWATKGERDRTWCCVSACRAEASCWPPVSLAKNKPGRRGEDSSPLSICIFSPLSLLPSLLNPSHRRQMKMHSSYLFSTHLQLTIKNRDIICW